MIASDVVLGSIIDIDGLEHKPSESFCRESCHVFYQMSLENTFELQPPELLTRMSSDFDGPGI